MRSKTETRRIATRELPRDARAEAVLEFVFNDEQEALANEDVVLNHRRDMPALQEYLEEMHELDSHPGGTRSH